MKVIATLILMAGARALHGQEASDNWDVFARVEFTSKFFKELNEYYSVPVLDERIKTYEGKEFTLRGHYLPFDLSDKNAIVISKYPYAQCFFCGGAGPESIAEIVFTSKRPRLKVDEIIVVKGKLKLNVSDVNHLNFILVDAESNTEN